MTAENPAPEDVTAVFMAKAHEAARLAWEHAKFLEGEAWRIGGTATAADKAFADALLNYAAAGMGAFRSAVRIADEARAARPSTPNGASS